MNGLVKTGQTCKILVDLNVTSSIDLPVRAATTLAAAIGADVHGLFIQEESLLDLAALPFSRAVTPVATQTVELSPKAMLQAFHRHSVRSRRELSVQAEKDSVNWSFSIERGETHQKILDALSSGDFLVLGNNSQGRPDAPSPPDTRGVVYTPANQLQTRRGPVVAIDEVDEPGEDAISLAARIATFRKVALHLFVTSVNDREATATVKRARKALQPDQKLVVHRFLPHTPQTMAAALRRLNPGFVVATLTGTPHNSKTLAQGFCRAAGAPLVLLQLSR